MTTTDDVIDNDVLVSRAQWIASAVGADGGVRRMLLALPGPARGGHPAQRLQVRGRPHERTISLHLIIIIVIVVTFITIVVSR
jgi:hypothetical protein